MSYLTRFTAAQDPDFQGCCLIALREIAAAIKRGDTITNPVNSDVLSPGVEDCAYFARQVLLNQQHVSREQVALLILDDAGITGKTDGTEDGGIQWNVKANWRTMVSIG